MNRTTTLLCLLMGTTAAVASIVTVDVGATAVDGVWRPSSCSAVQDGVVLTNIADNTRAVIEGCTITVDAGSDPSLSAVSIQGLGHNSSVELRGCAITASFDTSGSQTSNRHGAVRLEANATIGTHSTIVVDHSGVTMKENGAGAYGSAILLDWNITVGDHFKFAMTSSELNATCQGICAGLLGIWDSVLGRLRFGHFTNLTFTNTTAVVHSTAVSQNTAVAFELQRVTMGDHATVRFDRCNITATGRRGISFYSMILGPHASLRIASSTVKAVGFHPEAVRITATVGNHSKVAVADSNFTGHGVQKGAAAEFLISNQGENVSVAFAHLTMASSGEAAQGLTVGALGSSSFTVVVDSCVASVVASKLSAVGLAFGVRYALWASVSVTRLTAIATAPSRAFGVTIEAAAETAASAVAIDQSNITGIAEDDDASSLFFGGVVGMNCTISSTILLVSAKRKQTTPVSAVAFLFQYTQSSLTVISSQFVLGEGSAGTPDHSFVFWPSTAATNLTHFFENVTFSAPANVTSVPAFFSEASPSNAPLCLRNVRWENGTAIEEGPAMFKSGAPASCWSRTPTWTQAMDASSSSPSSLASSSSSARNVPPAASSPHPPPPPPPTSSSSSGSKGSHAVSSSSASASFSSSGEPFVDHGPPPQHIESGGDSNTAVVWGAVGGAVVVVLAMIVAAVVCYCVWRRLDRSRQESSPAASSPKNMSPIAQDDRGSSAKRKDGEHPDGEVNGVEHGDPRQELVAEDPASNPFGRGEEGTLQ